MVIVTEILHKILLGFFLNLITFYISCQDNFNHWFNLREPGLSKSSYISFFYLSMPIDNVLWRARIGIYDTFTYQTQVFDIVSEGTSSFHELCFCQINVLYLLFYTFFWIKLPKVVDFLYVKLLLCCCGDVEFNPGHKKSSLTFYHWNLNSMTAHDFVEISLI